MRVFHRIIFCLFIVSFIFLNASGWKKAAESYEARFLPKLSGGERPAYYDDDPYCWIVFAEAMVRDGNWRIRHTELDNAPVGRELHYSQSIAWLLTLTGKIRSLCTGEPWLSSIAQAGMWVNPLLFSIFLCSAFLIVEKRLGFTPAVLGVTWLAAHGDLLWAFHPYRPDHQSLHVIFSSMTLLFITLSGMGWTAEGVGAPRKSFWFRSLVPPVESSARRCFIAAGILQGLGLWTGAIVQTSFVALTVFSLMVFPFLLNPRFTMPHSVFKPELWRVWSISGAVTSLFMYAVEYFPNHLGWRLEVNHPLYALVWLAATELMILLLTIRAESRSLAAREWIRE